MVIGVDPSRKPSELESPARRGSVVVFAMMAVPLELRD
jgi:hypothetical protein